MVTRNSNKIILIDADVVSHFIKAEEIYALNSIFPYEIRVLDKVYNELKNNQGWITKIDELVNQKVLRIEPFPEENEEVKKEYFHLKKMMLKGDGESACLAFVRYTQNIIASSNLRDIQHYCKMHHIKYLTTMDFLCYALDNQIFSKERCNKFISFVLAKKGKLPVKSMDEFTCTPINF